MTAGFLSISEVPNWFSIIRVLHKMLLIADTSSGSGANSGLRRPPSPTRCPEQGQLQGWTRILRTLQKLVTSLLLHLSMQLVISLKKNISNQTRTIFHKPTLIDTTYINPPNSLLITCTISNSIILSRINVRQKNQQLCEPPCLPLKK